MRNINYKLELHRCVQLLGELLVQTDEDTPDACRTRHLIDAMQDARHYIAKFNSMEKKKK